MHVSMHSCMHAFKYPWRPEACQPWLSRKFCQPRLCETFSQIANHLDSVDKVFAAQALGYEFRSLALM